MFQIRVRVTFLLMLIPISSYACSTSEALESLNCFASVVETVAAAGRKFNPTSIAEDLEYIGVILKYENGFSYTATAGVKGQDKVTARIRVPKGLR